MTRKFLGFNQTIEGEHTAEELAAARACGSINGFQLGPYEVAKEHQALLPDGWALTPGERTHDYRPEPPVIPAAEGEPILMGFVKGRTADAHYPIWLYKRNPVSAAAAELGRRGGSRTSERKAITSRANGKRGGRPKKQ
jgi:hypothetical protein